MAEKPIVICSRGSALALAQAAEIITQCRRAFPRLKFDLKIIKTTGDKLQRASLAKIEGGLPKGLFTKELETALLQNQADLAIHSLKDLPTDLPDGLILAATPKRKDVRDVLIYRVEKISENSKSKSKNSKLALRDFPPGTTIATSSTRRKMSLLAARPDLNIVEIRGNVPTRLQKISADKKIAATMLALAGLARLKYKIKASGVLAGENVPKNLRATIFDLETMLPCVGQGAIGIETRADDERIAKICAKLNHAETFQCVTAERAFLRAMGGGCQSPVGAHAEISGGTISLTAISFRDNVVKRAKGKRTIAEAAQLGGQIAAKLK